MADDKSPKEGEKEAPPPGPKKILGLPLPQFAFVAGNVLVMLGGLGFVVWASLLYKKPPITEPQAVKEVTRQVEVKKPEAEGLFLENYPEMTITLRSQQGGQNRYATVEVSLLCSSQDCLDQVKANKAKVEDAIQSALAARSFSELSSLEVKFRVKHEIAGRVNSFLRQTAVVDVLFTNFIVQ